MKIGLPKEIKDNEYRVGLTPAGVQALTGAGHTVYVQKTAGEGSGFKDEQYVKAGGQLLDTADEVWQAGDMIVKVKEPVAPEYPRMRENQLLFTYLHLAPELELTKQMMDRKVTGVAYETITQGKRLPLLIPMSEVAGRMSVQVGATYLEKMNGGRGILLGGVPGGPAANVVIIGGGIVGTEGEKKAGGVHYRRFNISGITPGDDYAAMHQALTRPFRKVAEGEGARPDVLLIDVGGGQVAQALDVLKELGVDGIQVVGVAKGPSRRAGEETLVLADSGSELHPGSSSPALHLVAAVRDEAHRFAISGHRKRREKARERSVLEDVPGIGARRRSALLKAFGGMQGLERAGVEELMQVKGIDRGLAERIYASLHG